MLVHELTARFDIDKISAQGEYAPWVKVPPGVKNKTTTVSDTTIRVIELARKQGLFKRSSLVRVFGETTAQVGMQYMRSHCMIEPTGKLGWWQWIG